MKPVGARTTRCTLKDPILRRATTISPIRSRSGFTLIELALVASTIAILAVAVFPRFQRTAKRLSVERAAFQMGQLLRYAHTASVSRGQEVVFAWNQDAREATLSALAVDAATQLVAVAPLEESAAHWRAAGDGASTLRMEAAAGSLLGCPEAMASTACLRVFPDGTSEGAVLVLEDGAHVYTISVDGTTSDVTVRAGTPAA